METRIITLEPEVQVEGVSFEEAFGEHSELKGRGRARRQDRRQKRRMTRIENRAIRKSAKQEARQGRKDTRKSRRVARKAMGDEPELESATNMQDPSMESQSSEQSYVAPRGNSYRQPSYSEPAYEEEQPMGEQSTIENESYGEAEEPLGDNSEYSDEESAFDAETTGETSSFDAENSNLEGDKMESRLDVMKDKIRNHEDAVNNLKKSLQTGKLPSNLVAKGARELKARVAHLNKMKEAYARISKKARYEKSLTPVKSELNPSISTNKIVIPAKSADGEESSMLDGDEMSSFDGKTFFEKNKGIIIGLGAAAVIIFALNKAKVFK